MVIRPLNSQRLLVAGRTRASINVNEIKQVLGIPFGFSKVRVEGLNCAFDQLLRRAGKIIDVAAQQATLTGLLTDNPANMELVACEQKEKCDYAYDANLPGCAPDSIDEFIVSSARNLGLKNFIVIPDINFSSSY